MPGPSPRPVPARALCLVAACALAVAALAGCGGDEPAATTSTTPPGAVQVRTVAEGLDQPVQAITPPESGDLWVVEQRGTVRRVSGGAPAGDPLVDLSGSTRSGGEQGLLSLALHPDFPATDRVYVHRSDRDGDTLVTEHRVDAGRIVAEPLRTLLTVDQPAANHNGGTLAFGPDGLLYLGLGDGGGGFDEFRTAQDPGSRLGKLLRVDIATPDDWRVAALGLRNPWRFSFDPVTGHAWIGDVGQGAWEEIDVLPKGSDVLNFEWSVREGRHDVDGGADALDPLGAPTGPVAEYGHDEGCSVTGGVVVRDPGLPSLAGRYLYADYCSGTFWSIPADPATTASPRREPFRVEQPVSIDAGTGGRVYVTSHAGTVGVLSAGPS